MSARSSNDDEAKEDAKGHRRRQKNQPTMVPRRLRWWRRKGHIQLGVRCLLDLVHVGMSLSLAIEDIDAFHMYGLGVCQMISGISLGLQCLTALDVMFVMRAVGSFARVMFSMHLAVCGRVWQDEACWSRPWRHDDIRTAFRLLHIYAALRNFLNGHSLVNQYATPAHRTTPFRGHDELRRRSRIRAAGVPLHFLRAVLKFILLRNTQYERTWHELLVNLVRALCIVPLSAWSLHRQWLTPPRREFTSSAAATDDHAAASDRPHIRRESFDLAVVQAIDDEVDFIRRSETTVDHHRFSETESPTSLEDLPPQCDIPLGGSVGRTGNDVPDDINDDDKDDYDTPPPSVRHPDTAATNETDSVLDFAYVDTPPVSSI